MLSGMVKGFTKNITKLPDEVVKAYIQNIINEMSSWLVEPEPVVEETPVEPENADVRVSDAEVQEPAEPDNSADPATAAAGTSTEEDDF